MNNISIHETKTSPIAVTCQELIIERSHSSNVHSERELDTDLYSTGWFDGLMGYSPDLPHLIDYWEGYALSYREYCCGLLGVAIPTEELPQDRMEALRVA